MKRNLFGFNSPQLLTFLYKMFYLDIFIVKNLIFNVKSIYIWYTHTHIYVCVCVVCLVTHSCLTICTLVDCSPLGSSVHGIFQARLLEWAAIPFSTGFSRPRNWTSLLHCRWILYQLIYQGSPYVSERILISFWGIHIIL